jgi:predicted nucleic acid-binding protein
MKIYLETTIFNFYFDADRDAHTSTIQLFKEIVSGKFKPYTSIFVVEELQNAPIKKSQQMLDLISKFSIIVLPENEVAVHIANLFINNNIIPRKYRFDALHIALALVNNLDKIISLNFKHIVRDKTRIFTEYISKIHNYRSISINSPMEVIDYDDL